MSEKQSIQELKEEVSAYKMLKAEIGDTVATGEMVYAFTPNGVKQFAHSELSVEQFFELADKNKMETAEIYDKIIMKKLKEIAGSADDNLEITCVVSGKDVTKFHPDPNVFTLANAQELFENGTETRVSHKSQSYGKEK